MKLATIVLLGILLLGSFASMQAADPAGASQNVLFFTGGSVYTSDTTGICMWYPLLLGDFNMEFLFEFVEAPRRSTRNMLTSSGCQTSAPWRRGRSRCRRPPRAVNTPVSSTGGGTIYFTDVPRLRNWKDLTDRTTWGKPVARFVRQAGIFLSADGGMSGGMTNSAVLTSSTPSHWAGKRSTSKT